MRDKRTPKDVCGEARVKINSAILPVLVYVVRLVEQCSANTEAIDSNPVKVPKFFSG